MKFNTENSLKRFLKRKVKITLGLVVAFMITGSIGFAEIYTESIEGVGENTIITKDDPLLEMNISQRVEINKGQIENYGIAASNKGTVNINSENIIITTKNINNFEPDIEKNYSYGVLAQLGSTVNLGNNTTQKIDISTTTDYFGIGVYADNGGNSGGKINLTADTVNITTNGVGENGDAYGIYSITRTTNASEEDKSKVIIKANNTNITATSENGLAIGIASWSQGQVKINDGNVSITAKDVIHTRGNAVTEINANNNSQNIVILNGDIKFEYNGKNSGTTVNADVIVNLSNADSVFNGKIYTDVKINNPADDTYLKYDGMKLGLSNGGAWNVTGDSYVNELTFDNGVINIKKSTENGNDTNDTEIGNYTGVNDGETTINVENLKGANGNEAAGTVTFETSVEGNEIDIAAGSLKIAGTEKGARLNVGFSGINADDLVKNDAVSEAFKTLSTKVTGDGAKDVTKTYFAEQGELAGKITATEGTNGALNISQEKESDIVKGMKDLATINLLTWRQEMSSLNQRMGELRNSTGEHGVWARTYTGKIENGNQYDNEYQSYQVGYDKKYSVDNGTVFVGGLVSYSKGETNYSLGDGENYSVGVGVYATWLNNDGQFADLILKQSRLHNKFDVASDNGFNAHGDYNNWGTSLSGQYGKRFDVNDKFFVEPSVQLTLGRVEDTTYTTNSGINVHQDTMYSLIGNMGTAVGYNFSDKGNIYARAALVREFQGDIDTEYEKSGLKVSSSEDLGDTWAEFGIGVNYRFVENANVYLDLQKTGDSTVDTKWQANLGFRYEF